MGLSARVRALEARLDLEREIRFLRMEVETLRQEMKALEKHFGLEMIRELTAIEKG